MAQGIDGSWYAYVADATKANVIDAINGKVSDNIANGQGADYGRFAERGTQITYNASASNGISNISITDAVGFTFNGRIGGTSNCQGVATYSQGDDFAHCE